MCVPEDEGPGVCPRIYHGKTPSPSSESDTTDPDVCPLSSSEISPFSTNLRPDVFSRLREGLLALDVDALALDISLSYSSWTSLSSLKETRLPRDLLRLTRVFARGFSGKGSCKGSGEDGGMVAVENPGSKKYG